MSDIEQEYWQTRWSSRREQILAYISDEIADFLYYDRKEDEDLPRGVIEETVRSGELTVEEIGEAFIKYFRAGVSDE